MWIRWTISTCGAWCRWSSRRCPWRAWRPSLRGFDPRLAWIDLAGLCIGGFLLPLVLGRAGRAAGRQRVERAAELRALVVEEAQGLAELIALGAVDAHGARIAAAAAEMERRQRRLASLQGAAESGLTAAASLALWAAAFVMVPAVAAGALPRADLAMLTVLVLASFESVMPLPGVVQRAGRWPPRPAGCSSSSTRSRPVTEPVVVVGADRPRVPDTVGLRVTDLSFRYAADGPWVFRRLFDGGGPGAGTGIVGPDGNGQKHLGEHPAAVLGLPGGRHHADGSRRRPHRPALP